MNKIYVKKDIFIEGFDNEWQYRQKLYGKTGISNSVELLYQGKTSEISEELAIKIAEKGELCEFYWDYNLDDYSKNITAKESIQSACDKEYCIIYKNN
ncbi:MAG: hypothetical protein M0R51_06375 [Clostridia bacterium]|jgi:hypothetical protein|nr:hypothetical protein [Clostridia bacterium]